MSKTILYIATSPDGYVAGKDNDISWLDPYNDVEYGYNDFFSGIGALIQGHRTYDIEVKKGWIGVHPVPAFILTNEIPKQTPENYYFVNGDIKHILAQAKEKAGEKDVWIVGGANVAQQFLNQWLIDEIILTLVPIVLAEGVHLFDNIQNHMGLRLTQVKQYDKGLVQITYMVNKK